MNKRQQKQRLKNLAASYQAPKPYPYEPGKNSRIDELVTEVEANGWTVSFQDYCEDVQTPGMLGQYAGVCYPDGKAIKVKLMGSTEAHVIAILEHEIEHMNGAEYGTDHPLLGLKCGGRTNGWGEPVGIPHP